MSASSTVRVLITGDSASYVAATEKASLATDKLSGKMDESNGASDLSKSALLGLTGAVVGVGAAALIMGDKYDTAHAGMTAAIKAAGQEHVPYQAALDATEQRLQQLGFSSIDVEKAMTTSVVSTQNVSESLKTMSADADLARLKHESLADAANTVDKALIGNSRALKQLGIDLPVVATNAEKLKTSQEALKVQTETYNATLDTYNSTSKHTEAQEIALQVAHQKLTFAQDQMSQAQHAGSIILDALSQRMGGQASAYAQTFTGRLDVLRAQGENLASSIGTKLMPVIEDLTTDIVTGATWLDHNKEVLILLAGVVAGVAVPAFVEWATATWAEATAFIALNAPMLVVIATIAAVGAAAYELYTHWSEVWGEIKSIADDAWHFLDNIFNNQIIQIAIKPLEIEIGILKDAFSTGFGIVKDIVKDVWDVVKPIFDAMGGAAKDVANAIGGISKVVGSVTGVGKSIVTLGGLLADGGSASAGVPYIVGEQGPELFVPNVSGVVIPNGAIGAGAPGASGGSTGSGGDGDVTINLVMNDTQIATAIAPAMRAAMLRNKRVTVTAALS